MNHDNPPSPEKKKSRAQEIKENLFGSLVMLDTDPKTGELVERELALKDIFPGHLVGRVLTIVMKGDDLRKWISDPYYEQPDKKISMSMPVAGVSTLHDKIFFDFNGFYRLSRNITIKISINVTHAGKWEVTLVIPNSKLYNQLVIDIEPPIMS